MDLQTAFYIVAIIAFVLFIILLLALIYFVFFLKNLIINTQLKVIGKIAEFTKPVDVLKGLGTAVVGNLLLQFGRKFGMKNLK